MKAIRRVEGNVFYNTSVFESSTKKVLLCQKENSRVEDGLTKLKFVNKFGKLYINDIFEAKMLGK